MQKVLLLLSICVAAVLCHNTGGGVGSASGTSTFSLNNNNIAHYLDKFSYFLDGFHFHSGDLCHQMEARHYCNMFSEHVIQCVIMDANDTRLMGIEYVVDRDTFLTFDAEERNLWHSHVYEVKSGMLIAPNLPEEQELDLMKRLVSTYGKTFHLFESGDLPLGIPQLVMGFTADGQINPSLVADRDARFDISTSQRASDRLSIVAPAIEEGADSWMRGMILQLGTERLEDRNRQSFKWDSCQA